MVDNLDYVGLGLSCADVCQALYGIKGKRPDELSRSVHDVMDQMMLWVEPATRISTNRH
jgi:hypothetical protein